MSIELGKITVSPTPKPSPDLGEYVRNVGIWAREVEQAFRQVERAMQDVVRDTATKADLAALPSSGLTAAPGTAGETGAAGEPGPQGPPGRDGMNGIAGQAGATGATGATGAMGPQGPAGTNGSAGATGPQGPQGATGATGATGSLSFKGAKWTMSGSVSLSSGTPGGKSLFSSATYDTDSFETASGEFTIPTGEEGYYLILAQALITGGSGVTDCSIDIRNVATPATIYAQGRRNSTLAATSAFMYHASTTVYLAAGTAIEIIANGGNGSSAVLLTAPGFFTIQKMS